MGWDYLMDTRTIISIIAADKMHVAANKPNHDIAHRSVGLAERDTIVSSLNHIFDELISV
jgi:hypothetical protein